jgi:4-hydroxy-2-oxoheptanedioate aldolase
VRQHEGYQPLKTRMADGHRLRGLLVRVPSPMLIDMAGNNGFDFVLLDTEHGTADQKDVAEHITAAHAAGLPTVVRIAEGENALALRVLDAGAEGIVVPHVRDAAGAQQAVRMAHYPPLGQRGFATYTAAGRWGKTSPKDHAARSLATTVVIAMIEDEAGVDNAAAIAGTGGVDGIFLGPADLAAALQFDAAKVEAARKRVWAAAAERKSPVMAIVSTRSQAESAWEQGAALVVLNAQSAIDGCLAAWMSSP